MNGDHLVSIARIIFSSSLLKLGSATAAAGLATLTGILPNVIEALIFWVTGTKLRLLPDWTGWVLLVIGVCVAIYGSHQQLASQRPAAVNPHDVQNLMRLRGLIHPDLLFFRDHNFEFAFHRNNTARLDEFVDTWIGAHLDFVDADVQARLIALLARARALADALRTHTYALEANLAWSTVDPGPRARDAERRAAEGARLINAVAVAYVEAVDNFDATANARIA